jgi:hypothetical protein
VRAGEAIIKAAESDDAPLHLVLGRYALDVTRAKMELLRRDMDGWEETSLSADYPRDQATRAK